MLHTVNKSPFEKNSLATCLRLALAGSDILLIEDGVYAALSGSEFSYLIQDALDDKKIYALAEDLAARGLQTAELIDGIDVIDYAGFVDLVVRCEKVQTWF